MKTRRKRKRRYVASEEERRAEEHRAMVIPFLPALARTILYRAKVGNRDDPFAVAKYLAEEFRANPRLGVDRLADTLEVRWKQQGEADCFKFVGKMLKVLGEYLETEQPVFSKLDHGTIEIVMQHPCYNGTTPHFLSIFVIRLQSRSISALSSGLYFPPPVAIESASLAGA